MTSANDPNNTWEHPEAAVAATPAGAQAEIHLQEALAAAPVSSTRRVGPMFVITYALALFGVWMAINTPATVTLALRISEVDPDGKTGGYSLLAGVGTLVALIANPLFGRLSDRTASRFGMRRPWMAVGLIGSAIGAAVIALGQSTGVLLIGWVLMQLFVNATIAALLAVIADQVPQDQQGLLGGIAGMTPTAAILAGTFFVQLFPTEPLLQMGLPILAAFLFTGLFMLVLRDRRLVGEREAFGGKAFLGSFYFNPRKSPDFGWLLLSLFLIEMGLAVVLTYTVYFLQDFVGIDEADLATTVFQAALLTNGIAVLISFASGAVSDKLGRRKPVLLAAAVLGAAGVLVMVVGGTLPAFFLGSAVVGIGLGCYYGIYLGFAVSTMNDPANNARDLGLVNIAITLPFSVVPFIAPLVLGTGGDQASNYPALFIGGALLSLIGIPVLTRIRGSK